MRFVGHLFVMPHVTLRAINGRLIGVFKSRSPGMAGQARQRAMGRVQIIIHVDKWLPAVMPGGHQGFRTMAMKTECSRFCYCFWIIVWKRLVAGHAGLVFRHRFRQIILKIMA